MLHQLGCLRYSPPLESHIRSLKPITPGSNWEVELRGTSIWCVELIKREIEKRHPEAKTAGKSDLNSKPDSEVDNDKEDGDADDVVDGPANDDAQRPRKTHGINAILIDFFLYDTMKHLEEEHNEGIPHHRTRSIWY